MAIISEMDKTITIDYRVIPIVDTVPVGCRRMKVMDNEVCGFSFWTNPETEYVCALDERNFEKKKALSVNIRNRAQLLHQGKIILDEKIESYYKEVREMYYDFLKSNHLDFLVKNKLTDEIVKLHISETEDIYTGKYFMPILLVERLSLGVREPLSVECCNDEFETILNFILENFEPYAGEERYREKERFMPDDELPKENVKKRRKRGDGRER